MKIAVACLHSQPIAVMIPYVVCDCLHFYRQQVRRGEYMDEGDIGGKKEWHYRSSIRIVRAATSNLTKK